MVASPDMASMAYLGLAGAVYRATENPSDLYHNVLVALDPERYLNNGQPSAVARWIAALDLRPGDRVYHLGCGVGYYTAIMAEVVGPGGQVVSSEVEPGLASRAAENLAAYPNVSVWAGDGAQFDPGNCDAIFINAGVTHPHPLWVERLTDCGRLVLPLTGDTTAGVVVKIVPAANGLSARIVTPVGIYPCTSVRDPEMSAALAEAMTSRTVFKLKSVRTESHPQDETCLVHGASLCLSAADLN
jgi:protein-L-isoaspartate(D-aspartate) O-methyltransferase